MSLLRARLAALCASCAVASGCMVGPNFQRPPPPADAGYGVRGSWEERRAGREGSPFFAGADVSPEWWRLLGSRSIDDAVRRAAARNPGLEEARSALRRSQDALRAGYGLFVPQIDAKAGASRQRYNPAPGTLPGSTYNLFTLSGTVTYALDLWGGARRQLEQLGAGVDGQRYALEGALVMLEGNVVDALIVQAAYRREIEATEGLLVLLREQVRIADAQATAGTEPYSNVLSLKSQVASAQASIPPLEQKIDEAADLLAALSGETPASWQGPDVSLSDLKLPAEMPVSLPSRLVRQRPDVLMAEANLHAATAGVGVATAAMLPNLTLSGSLGSNATELANLLGPGSVAWGLAAGITQPLLHGGTLYYQREQAVDARDEAAAHYRQTVLGAFQQVADALHRLDHDAEAIAAQTDAVDAGAEALRLVQANYRAGIGTYLQVLFADTQYLQAQIALIQLSAERLQDGVSLYVALGGGWWNAPATARD